MSNNAGFAGAGFMIIILGLIGVFLSTVFNISVFAEDLYVWIILVGCGVLLFLLNFLPDGNLRSMGILVVFMAAGFAPMLIESLLWTIKATGLCAIAIGSFGLIFLSSEKSGEDDSKTLAKLRMLLLGLGFCAVGIWMFLSGNDALWWLGFGLILGGIGAIVFGAIVPKGLKWDINPLKTKIRNQH